MDIFKIQLKMFFFERISPHLSLSSLPTSIVAVVETRVAASIQSITNCAIVELKANQQQMVFSKNTG